jgi:hypothetical protein
MKRLLRISIAVLIVILFCSAAHAYKLPDTGQAKCYRTVSPFDEISCSGTGQDGEFNINPISYTDNGNGTVTDNNTSLVWQRCTVGQNNDATCSGTATTFTWDLAQPACGDLTLGNKSDWRVPSKKELISIVDYSVAYPGPTIKKAYFPNTIAGSSSLYWTSTQLASDSTKAWYTSFDYGSVYNTGKSAGYYVRCVRGDTTAQSFTPNGDGTVTDNRTGLIWQKCSAGQNETTCSGTALRYNWNDALNYCNSRSLANQTDWRLPSAKEFESLTHDTIFNPSVDTNFPNTDYAHYWWSSTTSSSSPAFVWYVAFGGGSVVSSGDKDPLANLNVRCVRGGQSGSPNLLVRLMNGGNPVNTYSTLGAAYDAASGGYIIQAQATDLTETLMFDDNKAVTLKGGYDSDFGLNLSMTTLIGSLTIKSGSLTLENLRIE